MLPASSLSSSHSRARRSGSSLWPIVGAAVLMLYTFVAGGGLLGGQIASERAYLLMMIPCLAPMLWCTAGFLRNMSAGDGSRAHDAGLILSAVGWAFLAAGLAFKYFAIIAARPDAYASQATSPATPLCLGLGVLCLFMGMITSWFAWLRDNE